MKTLNTFLEVLATLVEFTFNMLGIFFKGFAAVCLVFGGPVGWVILYLWDRDVKDRKERKNGVRAL